MTHGKNFKGKPVTMGLKTVWSGEVQLVVRRRSKSAFSEPKEFDSLSAWLDLKILPACPLSRRLVTSLVSQAIRA